MRPRGSLDYLNLCHAVRRHVERVRRHGRGVAAFTVQVGTTLERWRADSERRWRSGAERSRRD